MNKLWTIGTRGSNLATMQAQAVQFAMSRHEMHTRTQIIKSDGDIEQQTPLYNMGIRGVFTRSLDAALLNGHIDLAVHSLKDVPTQLAEGLVLAAVLPRAQIYDVLILRKCCSQLSKHAQIATGSLRRRAQWLNRYPDHSTHSIRGNIETRLQKLQESHFEGTILAEAALQRLQLLSKVPHTRLDWMVPAPAQGAIGVVCRKEDIALRAQLTLINHNTSCQAVLLERAFMAHLEAGCSAPLGAIAHVQEKSRSLHAVLLSPNGTIKIEKYWKSTEEDINKLGEQWAEEMLSAGGKEIMQEIRLQKL